MRRRLARGVAAFAVGFCGAALTVLVADHTGQPVRAERVAGPVDYFLFCRTTLEPDATAVLVSPDARGWRCAGNRDGVLRLEDLDVQAACEMEYGGGASATALDAGDPESWVCVVDVSG